MTISRLSLLLVMLTMWGCASKPEPETVAQPANSSDRSAQQSVATSDRFAQSKTHLPDSGKALLRQALNELDNGEYAGARNKLDELLELCPRCSNLYVLLGDILMADEQPDAAANAWQQAIEVNPDNYFACNRLGQWHREQGQFEQALTHYEQATQAWPDYAPALLNRAILNDLYLGDKAAALADYQRYGELQRSRLADFDESAEGRQLARWQADVSRQSASQSADQPQSQDTAAPGGQ